MRIPFQKMHGAANDFVVIDHREPFLPAPLEPLLSRMCDRRRGVGADGVLLIEGDPEHDFAMRYFNADGRPADYCGNGARCIARRAIDLGLGRDGFVRFRTAAGVQSGRLGDDGRITIDFGRIEASPDAVEVDAAGRRFEGRLIRAGVPHFVVEVERVEWVPVEEWGPALRHHDRFAPEGANVDFVTRLNASRVAMRTYERGVEAETLACGSGAMASAVWAHGRGDASPVTVITAGNDELRVGFEPAGRAAWNVTLEGPAEIAFDGEWREPVAATAPGAIAPGAAGAGA